MARDIKSECRLAQGLLQLYKLALAEGCSDVAEHLLCALEQIARNNPACEATVDQAYLVGCLRCLVT